MGTYTMRPLAEQRAFAARPGGLGGPGLATVAPVKQAHAAIEPDAPPAGVFLADALRALDATLRERLLALDANADGAIHDTRVTIRRIRTLLELGRDLFGRFHADEVRRAFATAQRLTGAVRDEEALIDLVGSLQVDPQSVSPWMVACRRRRNRLRNALKRQLQAGALDRARQLLAALLVFRVKPSRERRLAKFARRAVDRRWRQVSRLRRRLVDNPADVHRLRVAYKGLRYAIEPFSAVLPPAVGADLARSAARWQRLLGDLHDVSNAQTRVRRARALSEPARETLLAALAGLRTARLHALEAKLHRALSAPHASGTDSLRKTSII